MREDCSERAQAIKLGFPNMDWTNTLTDIGESQPGTRKRFRFTDGNFLRPALQTDPSYRLCS
jgi:hypothetical protein